MLKQLRSRKAMKRVMFWTLVLTIPSFVFFYGWQSGQQTAQMRAQELGWIKDKWGGLRKRPITETEQYYARRALEDRYAGILQMAGMPPQRMGEMTNLIDTVDVADEAIDQYYLEHLAREKGLEVSSEELQSRLERLFGNATPQQLQAWRADLLQRGISERDFILQLAHNLMLNKARSLVASRAKVSLFDLWQEYLLGEEQMQVEFVRIPTTDFEDEVDVTTDALQAYYENNQEDYRIGDQVRFRYMAIFRSDIMEEVDPSTDTVRVYYEENQDAFSRPRSVKVRHILRAVAPDAPTSVVEAARTLTETIYQQIQTGVDFAQLANLWSEDPSNVPNPDEPTTKSGGLIPFPIREDSPSRFGEDFKTAALSLEEDEVSSPVRSTQGFHIIKADEVTTGGIPPFEEVREQAYRDCKNELVDQLFRQRGDELRELYRNKSFSTLDSFAEAANLETTATELMELDRGFIPRLGSIRDRMAVIEDLTVGEFTGVIRSPSAYYVLEVNEKIPSHIPPLAEITQDVRDDYVTSMSTTLAHRTAQAVLQQARSLPTGEDLPTSPAVIRQMKMENLKQAAEARGYEVRESEPFTRVETDKFLVDLNPEFPRLTLRSQVGNVYMTTQGDPEMPIAYVVWYFKEKQEPSLEQFREDLPQVRAEYLSSLQQALLEEWLQDMRERIKAGVNPVFLESEEGEDGETPAEQG